MKECKSGSDIAAWWSPHLKFVKMLLDHSLHTGWDSIIPWNTIFELYFGLVYAEIIILWHIKSFVVILSSIIKIQSLKWRLVWELEYDFESVSLSFIRLVFVFLGGWYIIACLLVFFLNPYSWEHARDVLDWQFTSIYTRIRESI